MYKLIIRPLLSGISFQVDDRAQPVLEQADTVSSLASKAMLRDDFDVHAHFVVLDSDSGKCGPEVQREFARAIGW